MKRRNITTNFKTKQILTNSLIQTRPEIGPQQTPQCVYVIPVNVAEATLSKQAEV
jgi:hypothetical protein